MIVRVTKSAGLVNDQRTIEQLLKYLPDGDYVLSVETRKQWSRRQGRTNDQNSLMWAYLRDAVKVLNHEFGDDYWDAQKLHDYICNMWRQDEITPDGEVWARPLETSRFNKAQMSEFLQKVQAWLATEHNCSIPLPDDDDYDEFRQLMDVL